MFENGLFVFFVENVALFLKIVHFLFIFYFLFFSNIFPVVLTPADL